MGNYSLSKISFLKIGNTFIWYKIQKVAEIIQYKEKALSYFFPKLLFLAASSSRTLTKIVFLTYSLHRQNKYTYKYNKLLYVVRNYKTEKVEKKLICSCIISLNISYWSFHSITNKAASFFLLASTKLVTTEVARSGQILNQFKRTNRIF